MRELLHRGVSHAYAVTTGCARKGSWRMSKVKWVVIALPDRYFDSLELLFPLAIVSLTSRTAEYGPVRAVVWEGGPERGGPIPMGVGCFGSEARDSVNMQHVAPDKSS